MQRVLAAARRDSRGAPCSPGLTTPPMHVLSPPNTPCVHLVGGQGSDKARSDGGMSAWPEVAEPPVPAGAGAGRAIMSCVTKNSHVRVSVVYGAQRPLYTLVAFVYAMC